MLGRAVIGGLAAGAAGVAAMTIGEKVEQALTQRPNSYVPGRTLERLTGPEDNRAPTSTGTNWAMHWGQGVALGVARGLMAERGIRGPVASFMFMNLRLATDQTLENATGAGAPPWTWPRNEQVIDLLHKGVYAFTAGAVADSLADGFSGRRQQALVEHPPAWDRRAGPDHARPR